MRLQVVQSLDSRRVRLDFKKSPETPENIPSYEIDKTKADEFVRKYNKQSQKLSVYTKISTLLGGVAGGLVIFNKRSSKLLIPAILTGWAAGFTIGTANSVYKRNQLMKEYNVNEVPRK